MSAPAIKPDSLLRQRWRISGQVQGVGFRPFIFRIAQELRLTGLVRNDAHGVTVEAQGSLADLQEFAQRLQSRKPSLAVIDEIEQEPVGIQAGETEFRIEASSDQAAAELDAQVTVDTAICSDCLREMFDPADRRHGYGLINCTNCGPRYSIIRHIPYDRPNTTMADFAMCRPCRDEYEAPADRRFHAQPIACENCGPHVRMVDPRGAEIPGEPIAQAAGMLLDGKVLAIKGLGGFHLAVRADDRSAVLRLRQLKQRDHKPFALMCADLEQARQLAEISDAAASLMRSPMCPIILASRKDGARIAPAVAPGNHRLGVMLPYTPIHHLLFAELKRRGAAIPLVMTSGNVSDEPLVIDNQEAVQRLGGMCDAILLHDRPIERCVDDSIFIDIPAQAPLPIRRARGSVPASIPLPVSCESSGLCVGGEMKSTVAVVRGGRAILSQHLGELTHTLAFAGFKRSIGDLCRLFNVDPQWIAHDMHPVYLSTMYASDECARLGLRRIEVQHHHAHAAAVMAENGQRGPILAVVCDGTGFGTDRTIWGGELLVAELTKFRRIGRLRPIWLPGGDAASGDTRRSALALLYQAHGDGFADHPAAIRLVPQRDERLILSQMLRKGVNCTASSSAGRVFDGMAALLGLCFHNDFEAQAPMALESAAARAAIHADPGPLYTISTAGLLEVDLAPMVREIVDRFEHGWPAEELAALFHDQFARAWAQVVQIGAERTGIRMAGLSGGVFCNERLTTGLMDRLAGQQMTVLRHRLVPPNDGGLSFGQAAIAAAMVHDNGRSND